MSIRRKVLSVIFVSFTVASVGVTSSANEARSKSTSTSEAALIAAFQAEAAGDLDKREKLLATLSQNDSPSAQWSLGNLRDRQGEWKSIADCIASNRRNGKLDQYELERAHSSDSAAGHVELAKWCQAAKLPEQRRAHLIRALRIDPENVYAHQALGHRRSGMDWFSPDQIKEAEEREKRIQSSLREFGNIMRTIARELGSDNPSISERADHRLTKIRDSRSIPAMEAAFSNVSIRAIESGVHWLSTHTDSDAARSLMRFAVFHESEFVRQLASQHLSKRDFYEFAPTLIELVTSPVHSSLVPVFDREGSLLGFQHAFSREGVEQDQFLVLNTAIIGVRRGPEGSGLNTSIRGVRSLNATSMPEAALNAIRRTQDAASERELRVSNRNQQVQIINHRVSTLISKIAGHHVSSDPKELWGWWYEHNERERPPVRSSRYVRLYDESNYEIQSSPTRAMSAECFVKGTPVTTQCGLKSIEKIATGDLVLSQNIRTGELAWKPVVEATRRACSALLSIKAGADELKCTPGHVFWVSGKGWQKASELLPGNVLHSAKIPVAIETIDQAGAAETYNLIVAEYSNYFVGNHLLLSHDYTSRSYAPETVPGYLTK